MDTVETLEGIEIFLEVNEILEDVDFITRGENGFHFVGVLPETDDEVEVEITFTNYVYFDGELQDIDLPFNVWSIK